jgi:SAM-dependent methyltransferase
LTSGTSRGERVSDIATLESVWESLAQRDAFHAILTDETKAGGKWDVAEFMATGNAEIETVLEHLAELNCVPDWNGTALDFGCGVGRLTQALGGHFASCVGIDISESMIRKAQVLNKLSQCRYVQNSEVRLPFLDATFSFIYSNIVLQHIPPRPAKEYLHEFMRVLAPGGVLVFGVQDSYAASNLSGKVIRMCHVLHVRSRIKRALGIGRGDMQMHFLSEKSVRSALGSAKIVDVQLTNTAAKDFNGNLRYLPQAPRSGYIGKQYCVTR